jgi:hypothetical protein
MAMVILLLFVVSCAGNFQKNSYRGLGTMSVSYDVALKSAADLHGKGFISDEGKAEIIKHANSYKDAHNSAVQAFQDYLNAPAEQKETKEGQAKLAMQASLNVYQELLGILTKYGVYGEPVEPWF